MKEKTENRKERVFEIDLLRAIPIFVVMLYHLCFDFSMIPSVTANYQEMIINYPALGSFIDFSYDIVYSDLILNVFAPLVGGIFLFLAGISSVFTRSDLKRGLLLLIGSLAVSGATWLLDFIFAKLGFEADVFIGWGILHIMCFSILLYALIELFFRKVIKKEVPAFLMLLLGSAILFIGIELNLGIQIGQKEIIWPIDITYGNPISQVEKFGYSVFFQSAIGRLGNTVDFWPIFPYTGVLYLGIAFGKVLYREKKSVIPKLNLRIFKPLCFIGRHTIYFYLLHQVVFILVLAIVFLSLGFRI